jgi:hypothetical protein
MAKTMVRSLSACFIAAAVLLAPVPAAAEDSPTLPASDPNLLTVSASKASVSVEEAISCKISIYLNPVNANGDLEYGTSSSCNAPVAQAVDADLSKTGSTVQSAPGASCSACNIIGTSNIYYGATTGLYIGRHVTVITLPPDYVWLSYPVHEGCIAFANVLRCESRTVHMLVR